MVEAYTTVLELDEYRAAAEQLNKLLGGLQSAGMAHKEHGQVESYLAIEGTEFLRYLLQGHLDARSNAETMHNDVDGADGIVRNHRRRGCDRSLMTLFGEVTVKRLRYGKPGEESLFPLDAELNMPPDKYSHGLRQLVASEAATGSFDQTVQTITQTTGGHVPKHQAEDLTIAIAQDFERFYESGKSDAVESTTDLLVLSTDGKGIVMRADGLREATRKANEREQHKLKTRLSRGEKRNRKRMSTVAAVYTIGRYERTAESIMKLEESQSVNPRPRAQNKRVWASVEREPETVIDEMFQEALRRDPANDRSWCILVDGQPQQLKYICARMRQYQLKDTTIILDFVHVLEYLWKAAYCFHPEGSEAAEQWVAERALRVLHGKAPHVAAGIRRSAKLRGLSAEARKPADDCADYLLKYAFLLRYDKFLSQGLPIATGVIEGACRHLIKDRMDLTGARWGLRGAEAILKLRSLRSSADFDRYWNFHQIQELKRNHAARYASVPLQSAA